MDPEAIILTLFSGLVGAVIGLYGANRLEKEKLSFAVKSQRASLVFSPLRKEILQIVQQAESKTQAVLDIRVWEGLKSDYLLLASTKRTTVPLGEFYRLVKDQNSFVLEKLFPKMIDIICDGMRHGINNLMRVSERDEIVKGSIVYTRIEGIVRNEIYSTLTIALKPDSDWKAGTVLRITTEVLNLKSENRLKKKSDDERTDDEIHASLKTRVAKKFDDSLDEICKTTEFATYSRSREQIIEKGKMVVEYLEGRIKENQID